MSNRALIEKLRGATESGRGGMTDRMITELIDRAAAALEAQEWQPIETAPRDGRRVLLWCMAWEAPSTGQFYGHRGWGLNCEDFFHYQPTRWRPLPEPPQD